MTKNHRKHRGIVVLYVGFSCLRMFFVLKFFHHWCVPRFPGDSRVFHGAGARGWGGTSINLVCWGATWPVGSRRGALPQLDPTPKNLVVLTGLSEAARTVQSGKVKFTRLAVKHCLD